MNAVILSAALLALPADVPPPARWALIDAEAIPAPRVHVCPCGPGCACGPACDCPAVAPVKVPAIKRQVVRGQMVNIVEGHITVRRITRVPDDTHPFWITPDTKWFDDATPITRSEFMARTGQRYVTWVAVTVRPGSYGEAAEIHIEHPWGAAQADSTRAPTPTLTSPVAYPQHMAPLPAFRPMMPAPMYFGGFGGGGFGGCVGGA